MAVSREKLSAATAVAAAVAAAALSLRLAGEPGAAGYAGLELEHHLAPADTLLALALADARRWSPDATFLAIHIDGVRADGTVDLDAGEAPTVRLVSPSRARSLSPRRRDAAVREYRFTGEGLRIRSGWGGEGPWPRTLAAPLACRVDELARAARRRGLGPGESLRLSYDLRLEHPEGPAWRVFSENPVVAGYYRTADCGYRAGS